MSIGLVSLIGAGPGHPDYLTLKGFKKLQSADVIFYDALISEEMKEIFPQSATAIHVGKRCENHALPQRDIEDLLVHWAKSGAQVARLKGGDPFIFGRGGEEVQALVDENVPYEVIPGVSSLNGVASSIALPLTHRKLVRKTLIIEGHTLGQNPRDWYQIASFSGTIIIFMGSKKVQHIAQQFIKFGGQPDTKIALVESDEQMNHFIHLEKIKNVATHGLSRTVSGPAIIYIGPTIDLYEAWQQKQPVSNSRILFNSTIKENILKA